jgi:hypothetical protein
MMPLPSYRSFREIPYLNMQSPLMFLLFILL